MKKIIFGGLVCLVAVIIPRSAKASLTIAAATPAAASGLDSAPRGFSV